MEECTVRIRQYAHSENTWTEVHTDNTWTNAQSENTWTWKKAHNENTWTEVHTDDRGLWCRLWIVCDELYTDCWSVILPDCTCMFPG